jgi:hypothetical protein
VQSDPNPADFGQRLTVQERNCRGCARIAHSAVECRTCGSVVWSHTYGSAHLLERPLCRFQHHTVSKKRNLSSDNATRKVTLDAGECAIHTIIGRKKGYLIAGLKLKII